MAGIEDVERVAEDTASESWIVVGELYWRELKESI